MRRRQTIQRHDSTRNNSESHRLGGKQGQQDFHQRLPWVDRFLPSSKACSACGTIYEMKLSDRVMVCDCGNVMDRDLNAAINLRNKAASYAVPACGEEGSGHSITVTKPASVKQGDFIRFRVTEAER